MGNACFCECIVHQAEESSNWIFRLAVYFSFRADWNCPRCPALKHTADGTFTLKVKYTLRLATIPNLREMEANRTRIWSD